MAKGRKHHNALQDIPVAHRARPTSARRWETEEGAKAYHATETSGASRHPLQPQGDQQPGDSDVQRSIRQSGLMGAESGGSGSGLCMSITLLSAWRA